MVVHFPTSPVGGVVSKGNCLLFVVMVTGRAVCGAERQTLVIEALSDASVSRAALLFARVPTRPSSAETSEILCAFSLRTGDGQTPAAVVQFI